jgi:hypothetical protein
VLTAVEIITSVTNVYARTEPIPAKEVRQVLDALVKMCDIRDPASVSSYMYRAIGQAVSRIVCDRTKKKMPCTGLEPRIFCYPGRCPSQLDKKEHPLFV